MALKSAVNDPAPGRNKDLAGQKVKQGNWTVTYDDMGYVTGRVRDGGKSATDVVQTTHADDSADHRAAYDAAAAGDWDTAAGYINNLNEWDETHQTWNNKKANDYWSELVNQFGYDAQDYYNKRYDEVYGAGSSDVFDMTGGDVKTYDQLQQYIGAEKAEQMLGDYVAKSTATPVVQSAPTRVTSTATTNNALTGIGSTNDFTQYLKDMYQENLNAELAALKSAYDRNVLEMESQNEKIANAYREARNREAQKNELDRMAMNELAIAQGLNTGAAGQAALSQNAAYRRDLAALEAQEAASLSDNELAISQLTAQYNNAVQQATANGNYQLAQALYDEMIRQVEAAEAAEAARLEQERYEQEWLYKMQQDELDRQFAYAQLAAKNNSGNTATPVYKPVFDLDELQAEINAGNLTPRVLSDYEYYHGTPYVAAPKPLEGTAKSLYDYYAANGGQLTDARKKDLEDAYMRGDITADELNQILDQLGY